MIKKTVFKIEGMHCTSCAMDIDGVLEDTEGVVSANTNYAKSETEVEFDGDKISEMHVCTMLKNLDYEATSVKQS